ncbi:DUF6325 family protein [Microterricola pindariensis]|uniref:DUF1269 domain-containing family protein n=1 Tax=Microterricola pindariensis TaxID=478010 RepID=A0ABX5B0J5_9MICO|nr:DUF6325 family protein [Microterricola pindariensis]PPL20309.1 hypothetical protein GY24_01835 [Microterricola pindariensis]
MSDLEFGPVELVLAAFEGDSPNVGVIEAVMSLVDAGTVRLLDLVQVSRSESGELSFLEVDEAGITVGEMDMELSGLASEEDLNEFGANVPPGTSALLLVVELRWAVHLASRLAESNGYVIDFLRIPAPAVNAVVAEARAVSD